MLSAVVLAHNNEKTILRTIESLHFCDEIIVIDDQSTDATGEISRKAGANVVSHALHEDFAGQRNFALTKTKGDYILFVDSDEVVPIPLAQEISESIKANEVDGYFLKRTDYLYGKPLRFGETQSVRLLRLAKKNAGSWERAVHEVWEIHGKTKTLENPIQHYPHPTLHEFIEDINRYSTLHAEELAKEGKKATWLQIILYPKAKFFVNYVYKQGFRDGMPGLILALMMSFHSFLARGKLYLIQSNQLKNRAT